MDAQQTCDYCNNPMGPVCILSFPGGNPARCDHRERRFVLEIQGIDGSFIERRGSYRLLTDAIEGSRLADLTLSGRESAVVIEFVEDRFIDDNGLMTTASQRRNVLRRASSPWDYHRIAATNPTLTRESWDEMTFE
jgi:hypothetical protein